MPTNIFQNRISTSFTDAEVANLTAGHAAYNAIVSAKTVALTDEELNSLPSIDVANYIFVQDTITACDADGVAMLAPAFAAMVPEMVKDYTFYKQLDTEEAWLQDQLNKVQHTKRLAASESMGVANALYGQFGSLADAGVPGAAARYDQLKARYKGNGGRPPATNKPL